MTEPTTSAAPASETLTYEQIYRRGRQGWAWYLGGIATIVAMFLVVVPIVVSLAAMSLYFVTGTPPEDLYDKLNALIDSSEVAPVDLLFTNVVLMIGIPTAWLCIRLFHGLKPRWLSSVRPRIRWGWLFVSFGSAFLALLVAIVLGALLPASADASTTATTLNDFTTTTRNFLIIIVLTTPLQAAAEEYLFRGYLTQAFGGWFGSRAVAVVGPALLFALAHGSQSLPIFFDRFAFGVVAGVLVVATGGLEAGIAYHVLNNFLAYGFALAYSDLETALNPTGGSWSDVLITVAKSLAFLGISLGFARAMNLDTRTRPGVLEAPRARV